MFEHRSRSAIPPAIQNSLLMRHGGFNVYEGLVDSLAVRQLRSEAISLLPNAKDNNVRISSNEEGRGGNPARKFLGCHGGYVQDAIYQNPWVLEFLRTQTVDSLSPTGGRGTYSYYTRLGDFLDLHRDIETCDVAVITCLHDSRTGESRSGNLVLYPGRMYEPLSLIQANPTRGAIELNLRPGQTIVMYGGIVPHKIIPVFEGQVRIVSVLCYRAR